MVINTVQEFGVFDISGSKKYYSFTALGKMDAKQVKSYDLSPVVVIPRNHEKINKKPYLMDRNNIKLDDLISSYEHPSFDFSNLYSIDKLMLNLDYGIENNSSRYKVNKTNKNTNKNDYLRHWFSLSRSKISQQLDNDGLKSPRVNIIPIPDRLSVDAQDEILKSFGGNGKNVLLWRSVAACIGIEEVLLNSGLKEGSIVEVIDCNSTGVVVSKITMHEENGRLIPGHRIYYDCDSGQRKTENYPLEEDYMSYDAASGILPFDISSQETFESRTPTNPRICKNYKLSNIPDFVIALGDCTAFSFSLVSSNALYKDKNGECVVKGAGRFANRMSNKIVSYFDECDELSLVIFTKQETVLFKTLIKGTDKLKGGINVKTDRIDGIKLQKGSDEVRFFLRLGAPDRDKPLKVLTQKFKVDEELSNNPREIELSLYPSLVAGQGRAKVRVTVTNPKDNKIFKAVDLNWEEMTDAYSKKKVNYRAVRETLNTLEESLERSFPVSVPSVRASHDKFLNIKPMIEDYVKGYSSVEDLRNWNNNQSGWPYKSSSGVERFQRENCFGKDLFTNAYGFTDDDKRLIDKFLRKLNHDALKNWSDADPILTKIGWTYSGAYFPTVIEEILKDLERAAENGGGCVPQKFTICENLMSDDKQFVRYMKAFMKRMRVHDRLQDWLRGTHMILFHNDNFLGDSSISIKDYYALMDNLIEYYKEKIKIINSPLSGSALTVMIFLLKVRRFHPDFCKPDADDVSREFYERLYKITEPTKTYERNGALKKMLRAFLIGKGSLDLPIAEDGN